MTLRERLRQARRAAGLNQAAVAARAGLSRMTVQRIEGGLIDPRVSTVEVLARALGLDVMLVPTELRAELEDFVESGGKLVGRAPGVGAPPSIVDVLAQGEGEGEGAPRRARRGGA